jgi:Dockerin type I domain
MKKFSVLFVLATMVVSQNAQAAPLLQVPLTGGFLNVEYTVGSGSNFSVVIVDFADTGGGAYAFGYRWNPNQPTDYGAVIQTIVDDGPAGHSLYADLAPPDPVYGTFVNNFQYGSNVGNANDYWRLEIGTYSSGGISWNDSGTGISSLTTDNFSAKPTFDPDTFLGTAGIIGFYNSFDNDNPPAIPVAALKPGDFNLDGQVDAADIQTMLAALADLNAYQNGGNSQQATLTNDEMLNIGDLNGDGRITNADLQDLLNLLKNGHGSVESVPEPAAGVLASCAAICALVIQRCRNVRRGRVGSSA